MTGTGYFIESIDTLTAPLIPFTTSLVTTMLNGIGIHTVSNGNIISFMSQTGYPVGLAIVGECTGIVSLGTFTIALVIVLTTFPQKVTRRGLAFIAVGYIGTYATNIGRIIAIALSGYFFGPEGVIEQVHIHIGWILFSAWMIIFWYFYFTRQLGFSFFSRSRPEDREKH